MDSTLGMTFEAVWLSFGLYTSVCTLEPLLTNIRVCTYTHKGETHLYYSELKISNYIFLSNPKPLYTFNLH